MPRSRFSTPIKKYSVQSEPLVFPIKFGPKQLNKTIKNLLKDNDIDASNVNFNFFINGEQLKVPLSEFIESKGISEEIEEIVYDIELEVPKLDNEIVTDEIVTGLKINKNWVVTASMWDVKIFDITAPEKPVVVIPTDHSMIKVDWISLDETNKQATVIGCGEWDKVHMWKCNLETGESKATFDLKGHQKTVNSLSVCSDRGVLATGSSDGMVKIWTASEEVTDLIEETGGIRHVSKKREDVNRAITRIPMLTISAHNMSVTWLQWLHQSHTPYAPTESVDPSASQLLSCSNDQYLKLWAVNGQDTRIIREVHATSYLKVFDASTVNSLVVVGAEDNRLRCYDLRATVAEVHNIFGAHPNSITGVKWSPSNSNIFVTTGKHGHTKIWDIRNMKSEPLLISHFNGCSVTSCDWSTNSPWIANAYSDSTIKFYTDSSFGQ